MSFCVFARSIALLPHDLPPLLPHSITLLPPPLVPSPPPSCSTAMPTVWSGTALWCSTTSGWPSSRLEETPSLLRSCRDSSHRSRAPSHLLPSSGSGRRGRAQLPQTTGPSECRYMYNIGCVTDHVCAHVQCTHVRICALLCTDFIVCLFKDSACSAELPQWLNW